MTIAIVIGASGAVGKSLTKQLSTHPQFNKVIAVTRRPIDYASPKIINMVIDDFKQLDKALAATNADCLFCALGTTKKIAGSIAAQRKVDVDLATLSATIAKDIGINHFLLVSSLGADHNSNNAYLKMKGELENNIKQLNFNKTTIVRPSLLLARNRADNRIGETLGTIFMPLICKLPGLRKYAPVAVSAVAATLIKQAVEQSLPLEIIESKHIQ
ncbi:NAD(P)H-binding protein [Paraferrimonas sp. SM1919]|uniref:NAD(P)H-binding protein n=1 Tax=Paraferrimonas sp. SM1919 TaxID=2662263 RepID=UPI0013D684D7|nr:NAD(P)H-binding protein [Paraferrimonas sp. SM1919]